MVSYPFKNRAISDLAAHPVPPSVMDFTRLSFLRHRVTAAELESHRAGQALTMYNNQE